ncbi:MAG: AIM24 family protein [Armatimonadota bacterium]
MERDLPPSHTLNDFLLATAERDRPGDVFELESKRMLEVNVNGRIWSKLGAMIAYRGAVQFNREGAMEGGVGKMLKRFVSGEVTPLVKIEGRGTVYLADEGKHITILRLQPGEAISVNGNDLLAFEDTISYDITFHKRVAGMLAGGLFSLRLTGQGLLALMSHGEPLTLRCTPNDPITTDPNATIAWSGNLQPELKTDISFRSLIGRGGGETFQMHFRGDGFVVVQPFEEVPVVTSSQG